MANTETIVKQIADRSVSSGNMEGKRGHAKTRAVNRMIQRTLKKMNLPKGCARLEGKSLYKRLSFAKHGLSCMQVEKDCNFPKGLWDRGN